MNSGSLLSEPRMEHIAILAADKAALKLWYEHKLGFAKIWIDGQESTFVRASDGMIIEFLDAEPDSARQDGNGTGYHHIALSVGNFEAVESRLAEEGIAVQRRAVSPDGATRMLFFADPERNVIQIVYRKHSL